MTNHTPNEHNPHPTKPCKACVPVRLADGRHSGCWRCGDILLRQHRSNHLLRRPPALAFHQDLLRGQRQGLAEIMAVDRDNGTCRTISIEDFERYSFAISRGYGLQQACPLARWRLTGGASADRPAQLALGF